MDFTSKKMKNHIADDIWYEIFLHLPLDSVFKFRCCSKVWFSILSNPNFINHWSNLNNLSLPWTLIQHADPVEEISRDDNDKLNRRFTIAYPDSHSQFIENHQNGLSFTFLNPIFTNKIEINLISSSNGLVLCTAWLIDQKTYCVCNPLTRKWVSIPPPPQTGEFWITGFMCNDGLDFTSFKVIRIPEFEAAVKEFKIEVFCSDLGEWNVYDVLCPPDVTWDFSVYDNFVTRNGVFYWFQKRNSQMLAVCVSGGASNGTCCNECRLIDIPDRAVVGHLKSLHCLGESEGSICYAVVSEKDKSLSVWVLKKEDWCLLYKDNKFRDVLAEMESVLINEMGTIDLIKEIKILGFNPIDKNVVVLDYGKCIWSYNTRTKGYEKLFHPSFLPANGSVSRLSFLAFALKPWTTVLPPVSW